MSVMTVTASTPINPLKALPNLL